MPSWTAPHSAETLTGCGQREAGHGGDVVKRGRSEDAAGLRALLGSLGEGPEYLCCRKLGINSVSRVHALLNGATILSEAEAERIALLLARDDA